MSDTLITHHLPGVIGYIKNHYAWMETRATNCMITVDDLVQIASIQLIKLAQKWPEVWAETQATQETEGVKNAEDRYFWTHLKWDIKGAVHAYYERYTGLKQGEESTPESALEIDDWLEERTSVRLPHEMPGSRIPRYDIVDFFSRMPLRDKVHIALQYFDELTGKQMGDLLGIAAGAVYNYNLDVIHRMRIFARNQFQDTREPLTEHRPRPWEPPEALTVYLQGRHRMDIHEYVGIFTIALREDVSYLTDILGTTRTSPPRPGMRALSPFQETQVDVMLAAGHTQKEIAARVGVSQATISNHSRRRHAIA